MLQLRRLLTLGTLAVLTVGVVPPASAAERGNITGRVIDATGDGPVAGVRVTLTIGKRENNSVSQRTVTTDEDGRYVFRDLQTGEDRFYALDARFDGGLFPGSPITLPADTAQEPVIETTLRVWETTTDPAAILVRYHRTFVVPSQDGVGVLEAVTIVNPGSLAYIGRGRGMGAEGRSPSLGFWLPDSAQRASVQIVDSDLDIPERLIDTGFGFGITTAIPPGTTKLTYAYTSTGAGGSFDLTRRALYETSEIDFFVDDKLELDSNRLAERGEEEIEGRRYRHYGYEEPLDPADEVQVVVQASAASSNVLVGAAVGIALLLAVIGGAAALRRRRAAPAPASAREPETVGSDEGSERAQVVEEIARLDIRHAAGELDDPTWERQRAELKARLENADT